VEIEVALRVMPYVRQTRHSRWRDDALGQRARDYNESRALLRDAIAAIMMAERIEPFRERPLGMAACFWLEAPGRCDLGNLEKALEDAISGVLIPDDRWIWVRGSGRKERGPDRFRLQVWEVLAWPT